MGPNNRMIVNGVDLYEKYGLIFTDTYEMPVPEYKPYEVDIPGGNGKIDLTEFTGDISYSNRAQKFTFCKLPDVSQTTFERIKTTVSKFLHGKRFYYTVSVDPDYIYTGRFSVTSDSSRQHKAAFIVIKVDADPYKLRKDSPITWVANAAGGAKLNFPCGRLKVQPTIEVYRNAVVSFNGVSHEISKGSWKFDDVWFTGDSNELIINTYPEYSSTIISDVSSNTLDTYANKLLGELSGLSLPIQHAQLISKYEKTTMFDIGRNTKMFDLAYSFDTNQTEADKDDYKVYIQYPVYEL